MSKTASESYAKSKAEVQRLIERLQARLTAHAAEQARHPNDWGFAGDLEYIAECLRNATGEGK